MTLREAAQAALTILERMDTLRHVSPDFPELDNLRTALSAPPDPGWEEGYRAGIDAAKVAGIKYADKATLDRAYEAEGWLRCFSEDVLPKLPVPSAPTQAPAPEARYHPTWTCPSCAQPKCRAGCGCTQTGICRCPPPAPEAKTAESEGPRPYRDTYEPDAISEIVAYSLDQYRVRAALNGGAEGHTYENGWCDALAAVLVIAGVPVPEDTP